ncbi:MULTISPECIES: hypothetical protein [Streptomyces]|uniref:Uncharacterized protein n=2 Tax=Streptomyces TaxID=1883 RepID=A0A2N8P8K6_STRNR|nr:hypothetical protein AOB60_23915 [Streptomyces noursei]SHM22481.1 NADH:flavin oxidoreductase / NADH oxidase family protein [Streptomyces yunnanensis]
MLPNVEMDAEQAAHLVASRLADVVAFGRPFIANPDLPARLATGAPLADIDWTTVYTSGARGYTDYPGLTVVERPLGAHRSWLSVRHSPGGDMALDNSWIGHAHSHSHGHNQGHVSATLSECSRSA